ncbi:MAG: hypothetical protein RMK91_08805 [Pseudanabaenaceae cyanobacterium SKYGB_i_bin29]|nr:hypothetical protein [Pseudanabaenaceae cyanobacterium SKYG29]MDW8421955.1 hypothetical protein [Pseudanabaenaceae cyanobacterium SKYGB_i_bin29]
MEERELLDRYKLPLQRLIDLQTWGRWLFSGTMWLTIGLFSLWQLRREIALMAEFFTWAAVRATIKFRPLPSLGVMFCVSTTLATLVWQSQHILFGFSPREYQRMVKYLQRIESKGDKHPLWRWLFS